jgi:peptide/nickel transport system substrate-binding protein
MRRRISLGGILLAVLALGAACSRGARDGDTLIIGVGGSLNLGSNNPVMIQRNANVWETLTELDDSLTSRPGLAESWQAGDRGRTWTFRLRKGVLFHDGTRLSASLVVRNVRRMTDHPELDYYNSFRHLVSAEAPDELTVKLVFSRPKIDLPNLLGHYFIGIFSPSAFDEGGRIRKPVGSGPYIFEESRIGRFDRVSAFDGYHGGKPHFRLIEFAIIPDPVVRVMSLLRGDIDIIAHHGGVPASLVGLLEGRPDVVIRSQDVAITHYLLFNCGRDPFRDRSSRAAFAAGIDREELVKFILRGAGVPARDYFVDRAARWNKGRFSIRAENPLGAGMGMESLRTRPLVFLLSQGDVQSWGYRYVAEYLADVFSRVNVTLDIEVLESGAWSKAVENGDYDLTLYPLSMPTGTPELMIRRLIYSEGMKVRGIGNTTRFASTIADDLFLRAVDAPDAASQEALFNEILDLAGKELPVAPLFHEKYFYAYRKGLSGIRVDPFLKIDLGSIRDKGERP